MPDGAIVIPDTAVAPKDYTLSGAQEIALKTVRAVIDGSGAGSAFLPTLQLLDPNGHVMWEGATPTTVAAGGSADVSWFPGLGAQTSSTTGGTVMEYATAFVGAWSWPSGAGTFVDFTGGGASTTDGSVIQNTLLATPGFPLTILKAGIYLAWCGIGPWDPAWGTQATLANMGPDFGSWAGMGNATPNYPPTFTPYGGVTGTSPALLMTTRAIFPADPAGGAGVNMEVAQGSGAARTVGVAMHIIRLTSNGVGF